MSIHFDTVPALDRETDDQSDVKQYPLYMHRHADV